MDKRPFDRLIDRPLDYILDDDDRPVPSDPIAGARWRHAHRERLRVGRDRVAGDQELSTIFLGLDHGYDLDGPPVLWETAIISTHEDGNTDTDIVARYTTIEQARMGHATCIAMLEKRARGEDD